MLRFQIGGVNMRCTLIIMTALALISTSTFAGELKRLSLDDISSLGLSIQTDSEVKTEGKGSIRITTNWPTTVCLGEVSGLNVENARLIYRAQVKSDIDGVAFLEMWAHVGGDQYFSKGVNDPVKGRSAWRSVQIPFMFQKGQNPDKVTLNLVISGRGTVWIDDIVLSKEPLK
jgi:hypothetical protein